MERAIEVLMLCVKTVNIYVRCVFINKIYAVFCWYKSVVLNKKILCFQEEYEHFLFVAFFQLFGDYGRESVNTDRM